MRTKNRRWLSWVGVVLLGILVQVPSRLLGAEMEPGAPTDDPPMGRLVIEGQAIERLILEKRSDPSNRTHLRQPGPSVAIAPGEYRVREVRLRGGYRCFPPGRIGDGETGEVREVGWFTVGTDTPHVLRIGAPLKPTLTVVRENRTVRMAYSLLDASEQELWQYIPEDFGREKLASYSVCRGGQLVGSGALAPGG
ncbi:MAG: hypothetical protein HQ582_02890 [Planctomycetes bacterium]|nr:hypothetical protein [Planctomycetota bacterium]